MIWFKEEYVTAATYRMQLVADKLNSWTEKWCVAVNKDKSSTTLFTLSPKQKAGTITLGGTPLKEDEEATYLGVCNGPGVVQRRDRQKKEFHDQSDYR